MSLREFQSALAELFTSSNARALFARDKALFARRFRLDARDCSQLDALGETVIAAYAGTLVRKRRIEAARLLPQTRAALGEAFASEFERWAQDAPLTDGPSRYVRDARDFCRFLLRSGRVSGGDRNVILPEMRALR